MKSALAKSKICLRHFLRCRPNTRYGKVIKQISGNTNGAEIKRHDAIAFFEKCGNAYNFDPLMLAAQGFQESQLNQGARSRARAIGIIQVMPATGKQLNVDSIAIAESNINRRTWPATGCGRVRRTALSTFFA